MRSLRRTGRLLCTLCSALRAIKLTKLCTRNDTRTAVSRCHSGQKRLILGCALPAEVHGLDPTAQYLLGGWRFRAGARRLPDAPPPASPAPLPAAAAHLPVPAAALTSAPHTRPLAPGLRLVPSTSHSSPHSCSTLEGPFLSRPPPSLRLSPPPPPPSLSSRPAATSPPSLLPAASTPWRPPRTTPPP